MRRALAPVLAIAAVTALAPEVAASESGVRPCRERVEGGRPSEFARPGAVVVGRLSFAALERHADPDVFASAYNPRTGLYQVKSGVGVRANRNVKLSIGPAQRSIAGLGYDRAHRSPMPGNAASVRFQPCPRRTPAFSYDGFVGGVTGFSGGFVLAEPACLVLEARVRGREPVRRAVSFGMGDTCAQPA
jgi:hypothetical protein